MNFKNWVKSIQTAGYNGARTVLAMLPEKYIKKVARTGHYDLRRKSKSPQFSNSANFQKCAGIQTYPKGGFKSKYTVRFLPNLEQNISISCLLI